MGQKQQYEKVPEAQAQSISRWPWICSINIIVPFLFLTTIVLAVFISMGEAPSPGPEYLKYSVLPGYFHQDEPETDWKSFDYTHNFGLISEDWHTFQQEVDRLNKEANSKTEFKVLFLGRHGEGYHNVAEAFYGTKAWDCFYSMLEGNKTTSWADAELTSKGIDQALLASQTWQKAITSGLPAPESYYTSPLRRCMQTAYHTFSPISTFLNPLHTFTPKILELLRETIGVHTCDRRSTKSQIHSFWKSYDPETLMPFLFEPGFTERDEMWDKELRELEAGEDGRSLLALDSIFKSDKASWISVSGHSGIIGSLLRVLGHRTFGLTTGAVIPILVRCEIVEGTRKPIEGEKYEKIVGCKEPPERGVEGAIGEPRPHGAVEM